MGAASTPEPLCYLLRARTSKQGTALHLSPNSSNSAQRTWKVKAARRKRQKSTRARALARSALISERARFNQPAGSKLLVRLGRVFGRAKLRQPLGLLDLAFLSFLTEVNNQLSSPLSSYISNWVTWSSCSLVIVLFLSFSTTFVIISFENVVFYREKKKVRR